MGLNLAPIMLKSDFRVCLQNQGLLCSNQLSRVEWNISKLVSSGRLNTDLSACAWTQ